MSEATTGVPAANASVSTMPNDSPPERRGGEHVRGLERRVLLGVGDAAEDPHAGLVDEHRGDLGLGGAHDVRRAGTWSRSASKARSSTGRPLRSTDWPTKTISSGCAGEPQARRGDAVVGQRDAVGHDPVSPP